MTSIFHYARAALGAALIIGVSAALAWLSPRYVSTETAHRILGTLLGGVVVVYANAIPKYLLKRQGRYPQCAGDQAARRFAGWSMVLGGMGYMLAWLFAPIGSAALVSGSILAAGLLAAVVRCRPAGSRRAGG